MIKPIKQIAKIKMFETLTKRPFLMVLLFVPS